MSALFPILIIAVYLFICYQDFRHREVYLLAYTLLYGLYAGAIIIDKFPVNVDFVIINSCVLSATVSLLLMYYIIRYSENAIIKLSCSIGLGDVLLLPAFILSFSPGNLIIVLLFSLIASLGYYVFRIAWPNGVKTIPLAGIQSFLFSIVLFADYLGLYKMQVDYFTWF